MVAAILRHYAGLPEVSSGAHAPVYYWLAPFAVNAVSRMSHLPSHGLWTVWTV